MNYDNIYFTYLNGNFIVFLCQEDLEKFLSFNGYSLAIFYVFKSKKFIINVFDSDECKVGVVSGLRI